MLSSTMFHLHGLRSLSFCSNSSGILGLLGSHPWMFTPTIRTHQSSPVPSPAAIVGEKKNNQQTDGTCETIEQSLLRLESHPWWAPTLSSLLAEN